MASYHYSTAALLAALITFGAVWVGYRATKRDQRLGIDGGWPLIALGIVGGGAMLALAYLDEWLLATLPAVWLTGQILFGNLIAVCLVGVLHALRSGQMPGRAQRIYFSVLLIAAPAFAIYALAS